MLDLIGAGAPFVDDHRAFGVAPGASHESDAERLQRLDGGVIRVWIPDPAR